MSRYDPLLNLIGKSEGTDKGDGYNETLGYGAYTGGDVNLVGMSLNEIETLQNKMLAHPKNYLNSSAVGRYQIIRTTLRSIRTKLGIDGHEKFDKEMQDRMGKYLLGVRGIDKYIAGTITENEMITNLSKEWASLPQPNGKGYYGGQNASVSVGEVRTALRQVRDWQPPAVESTIPGGKYTVTGVVMAVIAAIAAYFNEDIANVLASLTGN